MSAPDDETLRALITFRRGADTQAGASRLRLLSLIAAHGSISAAARIAGLSYKGAWDAVQALNNLSPHPLVLAQPGGAKGGAAQVTPAGHALIAAYGRLETLMTQWAAQVSEALAADDAAMTGLIGRIGMKTSARNAYAGTVGDIRDGAVNAEVTLIVSENLTLRAIITRESVDALGLKPGVPVTALIKSGFVVLAAGHAPLPVSADNRLLGVVETVVEGAVNDEVTLRIDDGKTVTAVLTRDSRRELALEPGVAAQALISASHIILAVT